MALEPTRVGIAGLGEAGFELHLPALASIPGAEVVGACDPAPEMRDRASRRWSIPVFHTLAELLDETSPEILIVATPPGTHLDLCLQALESGAHLLIEKPFVASLDEADRLIAASETAGSQIALNHEFREMPILRALRSRVKSAEHGRLVFLQLWQLMNMPGSKERGWRGELRHRTLFEAGVHLVDFAMLVFGEKPRAVSATLSAGADAGNPDDSIVTATLEFTDGRLATILQNRLAKGPRQYFEARADTTEASFRASFGGRARITAGLYRSSRPAARVEFGISGIAWMEAGDRRRVLARNPANPRVAATRYILEESFRGFRGEGSVPVDAHWGRNVLEVVVACYRSAELGARIELDSNEAKALGPVTLGGPRQP